MAYIPLQLSPVTPPIVAQFVYGAIEKYYFMDVHAMLRLPLPEQGINAGQNSAAAQVLLAVISAVSATLFDTEGLSGELFKGLVEKYFPWDKEPDLEVSRAEAADVIYKVFRNPLTHSAGLMTAERNKRRFLNEDRYKILLKRVLPGDMTTGHPEVWIEQLERSASRPGFGPTLVIEKHKRTLFVEGLYWGCRQMIQSLTADEVRMRRAAAFLSPLAGANLSSASDPTGSSAKVV